MNAKTKRLLIIVIVAVVLVASTLATFVAIKSSRSGYSYHISLGDSYYNSGDYDNAIIEYQKAVADEPNKAEGYVKLAKSYNSAGMTVSARSTLELALARGVDSEETINIAVQDLFSDSENYSSKEALSEEPNLNIDDVELENDVSSGVKGIIVSATTGKSMKGVKVIIREGSRTSGDSIMEVETDASGIYSANIEKGSYTLEISYSGYIKEYDSIYVGSSRLTRNETIAISPELTNGAMRFVLEWGEHPSDLDSYLEGKLDSGETVRVNYTRQQCEIDGKEIAVLDVDDINGYGPETTTLNNLNGKFKFFVRDYLQTGTMSNSGATVKIYSANSETPQVVEICGGLENLWNVCEIDHGTVKIINSK